MKYFIDTEFHEHKRPVKFLGITIKKVWTIDLISIGIIAEDGREYYAINRDLNLKYARKDKWLKINVLDKLPEPYPSFYDSPRRKSEALSYKSMAKIKEEIITFCGGVWQEDEYFNAFLHFSDKPEFWAYYADYDWVVFCWIFGRMMDLPHAFPMYCRDLKQKLDEKAFAMANTISIKSGSKINDSFIENALDSIKGSHNYPKQQNEHNALDDAKWNFDLYKFLLNISI